MRGKSVIKKATKGTDKRRKNSKKKYARRERKIFLESARKRDEKERKA